MTSNKDKWMSVRLDQRTLDRIRKLADEQERSVNGTIRFLIKKGLKETDKS